MSGFQDILGNETIKEYFQKVLTGDAVSHAYILTGEAGMGRKTLARAFAMTLQCENSSTEPCGQCHSCKMFQTNNHPDVIYVTHEKAGSIGVDDVRTQLINDIAIKPYSSPYKIYMIDEAEKLTVQAQNALLKTIEEPPAYGIIIFITTNADAFLPTILSRCVTLKLKPLYDKMIKSYLQETMRIREEDADIYTAFARGNLGKAISLAGSEAFEEMRRIVLSLLKSADRMSVADMQSELKGLKDGNFDMEECLDFMTLWFRDVLMFKATKDMNLMIFQEEYSYIKKWADRCAFEGLERIMEAFDKAKVRLKANVNFELTMELLLLTIKEN